MKGSDVVGIRRAVFASIVLLLIAGTAAFYWMEKNPFGESKVEGAPDIVIVKEAVTEGGHYVGYVRDGAYYVEDRTANQSIRLRASQENPQSMMVRQEAKPAATFTRYEENGLVDPTSLGIGIVPSIPYTFDCTPEQSFVYLETLLADGWTIDGYYGDWQYIDYYIRKENVVTRLIVLEDRMKLFYDVDWQVVDPKGYVSR
ncbi:hypothetical protein [Paenibacillus xylaniclasticus]|uniref:hypothetical protein n=1 Tax=Paenibacillus xylaniclasticus TaxID=588083 RepID=UPI000FDAB7E8|nr:MULTISPECIES: hypothetical protein [Paenibacillus]GFN30929.1 hypothetical protein PCURB6_11890 [Paenibacillus curdlanolyticus]